MSFILKALKKLEEEKTALTREPVELNSALLTADAADAGFAYRPRRTGRLLIVLLAFFSGIGATYFFARKPPHPVARSLPAAVAQAPAPSPAPQPSAVTPAEKTEPVRAAVSSSAPPRGDSPLQRPKVREVPAEVGSPRQSVSAGHRWKRYSRIRYDSGRAAAASKCN
jgi:hypothetical protein